jgi:hypothetical protein
LRAGTEVEDRSRYEFGLAALGDNTLDKLNFKRLHSGGVAMLRHRQNHAVARLRRGRWLLLVIMLTRMIVRVRLVGVSFSGLRKLLEEMVHAVRRRSGKKQ